MHPKEVRQWCSLTYGKDWYSQDKSDRLVCAYTALGIPAPAKLKKSCTASSASSTSPSPTPPPTPSPPPSAATASTPARNRGPGKSPRQTKPKQVKLAYPKFTGPRSVWLDADQQTYANNKRWYNRMCVKVMNDGTIYYHKYEHVATTDCDPCRATFHYAPPPPFACGTKLDTSKYKVSVRKGDLYISGWKPQGCAYGPYICSKHRAHKWIKRIFND